MKFKELDTQMRVYETAHDHCVLPEVYIVARLDGRGFTKLTKETLNLEKPFDSNFNIKMVDTVRHLMQNSGFNITYGYTQSDEISLLFNFNEDTFNRKERKINSVLAGQASAYFSLLINHVAAFDCRVCQLPNLQKVTDYFRWRQEDASRNALNSYCYWTLRQEGKGARQATRLLEHLTVAEKNELLFQRGVNFNDTPIWQRRGTGIYWENTIKEGLNPLTNEKVQTSRRTLATDHNLSIGDAYTSYVQWLVTLSPNLK